MSFRYRLEFIAFRVFAWMIEVLPERLALGMCAGMGWLGGVVLRIRRADVDRHLAQAFPERDSTWRGRVARDSYRHFAREAAMTFRLSRMDPRDVVRRTEMEGFEEFREAVEEGAGAVVVSGHLGNWEIAGASAAARGVPMDVVAHRQKNPLFDRYLVETRARLGLNVMVKNDAFRLARRSLAAGSGRRLRRGSEHPEARRLRGLLREPRRDPQGPGPVRSSERSADLSWHRHPPPRLAVALQGQSRKGACSARRTD